MSNTSTTKSPSGLDLNDVEMVFGSPNSPKVARPDVHTITNERKPGNGTSPTNNIRSPSNKEAAGALPAAQPLLEPDKGKPKPPLAGPEIDDLDDRPLDTSPFPGIDDGLLDPVDKTTDVLGNGDVGNGTKDGEDGGDDGTDDGKWLWPDETDYPYPHEIGTRFGADDRPISPIPGSIPDVNTYQQKKNLAQGMMDLALLSANANQLRYVIETSSGGHPYYYTSLIFISLSIILQIAVGVGLIMNSRYNVKDEKDICKADKINNMTVLGIFLITIVNVFISSFSVAPTSTGLPAAGALPIQQAGV